MAATGNFIEIDISDVDRLCREYKSYMSKAEYDRMIYRIVNRTKTHVAAGVSQQVRKEYVVPARDVKEAVKTPQMRGSGSDVGCIIPIRGTRRGIGTKQKGVFGVTGASGAPGWRIPGPYRIKAHIVKAKQSILPQDAMKGVAPFRNTTARKLNGLTFTRAGKERTPISKISGIAVPQMPWNRSRDDIQKDIADFALKQAQHEIQYRIGMIK